MDLASAPPSLPPALSRRRRRMSDAETAVTVLETAVDMVNRSGLTVGLDHISFEEVIQESGVSRSSAYRRWPYKGLFFADLLKELGRATTPAGADDMGTAELIRDVVRQHRTWLKTPKGRTRLALELFRQASLNDFRSVLESPAWRTYLALHATYSSLADGELRSELQVILSRSEAGFVDRIASAWSYLCDLLGFRLRPDTGATFEDLAVLLTAEMRGLVLMNLTTPGIATKEATARIGPLGARPWSLVALGTATKAMAFLEPDPEFRWDSARSRALDANLGAALGRHS